MGVYGKFIGVVSLAVALTAGAAGAATLDPASGGTKCALSNFTTSTACAGAYEGNNSNQDLDGLFGEDWGGEFLKIETPKDWNGSVLSKAASGVTLTILGKGDAEGTWSVDTWGTFTKIMAVLKGGSSFSAYLVDLADLSGTWNTLGIEKGNGKPGPGLSHISFYGIKGDVPPPSEVPLPAAGWLMLAGIGGLAALRRRKA
jgi:hypothetical protein